jgi:hypothetical protein
MKSASARIVLLLALFLMIGVGANAQTRGEFIEIEQGFKIAKAIEEDGTRSILVLFPEQYLKDAESYKDGTLKVLPLILGCETFKDCKPLPAGRGESKGRMFVVFEIEQDSKHVLVVFKLGNDSGEALGIIIQLLQKDSGR